jgi:hypothetical protein
MMMLDPNHQQVVMEENRQKLLRAARLHQLYSQADAERAQFGERLMTLVGDLMISGGQKLKARSSHPAIRYTTPIVNG